MATTQKEFKMCRTDKMYSQPALKQKYLFNKDSHPLYKDTSAVQVSKSKNTLLPAPNVKCSN